MGSTTLKTAFVQSAIAASLLLGGFEMISARTVQAEIIAESTPTVLTTIPVQTTLPKTVEQAVKQAARSQFSVPIVRLQVTEYSEQNWPDGCLGLKQERGCTLAFVRGYRVSVSDGTQTWHYRTDQTGRTVRLEAGLRDTVERRVKESVQSQFGAAIASLKVTEFSEQNWPDGCLGLPLGKEMCTMAVVPGFRVSVSDGIQTWHYRTDIQAYVPRLESAENARLPITIAQKLVKQVAADNRASVDSLRVTEVKSRTFDGCLGLVSYPLKACTKIGLPGWQVIVEGKSRIWVYHLTQDGSRIIKNPTASGATTKVRPSFEYFGAAPAPLEAGIVFRSTVSGGLTGEMQTLVLTEDGKLTRYTSGPLIKTRPVVLTTLSPQALARFKNMLDRQRYANLNGITYLTAAAVADYPTTQFEAQGGSVQYLSLVQDQLPRSLQQIIRQWEALIPSEPQQ